MLRLRRKRRPTLTHPTYYGHILPGYIVCKVVAGECPTCQEWVDDFSMPCPHCIDS